MKQRTITAAVLLAIFLPLLIVEELFTLFQILMLVLVIIGAFEMIKMFEKEKKMSWIIKISIAICAVLAYLSALAEYSSMVNLIQNDISEEKIFFIDGLKLLNITINFLPIFIFSTLLLFTYSVFFDDFNSSDVGKALMVIVYVGLGFASLTILRFCGLRFIVFMFLTTIFTDVFAYFFGMRFGKHKMAPKISPKKSWEGAIAGTILGSAIGAIFASFYGFFMNDPMYPTLIHKLLGNNMVSNIHSVWIYIAIILITILVSIFGQIGDLVASRMKRTSNIKDFGRIFPGHGGVLDRLDSAIFAGLLLLSVVAWLISVV